MRTCRRTSPRFIPLLLIAAAFIPATAGAKAKKVTKRAVQPSRIVASSGNGLPNPFGRMPARKPPRLRAAGQANWIEGVSQQQQGTNCSILGQIQCIGISSKGATSDLTNANWIDPANPSSTGRYCPAQAGTGQYGGIGLGFRPLARGQTFEIRFKLRSTVQLKGAAASPADELTAAIQSTGVYANPVTPKTWVNVIPDGTAAPANVTYPNPSYTTNANRRTT